MRKFVAFCVLLAGFPALAAAQPRVVVVPFPDVSAVSGKMPSPTSYLTEQLTDAHVAVSEAGPIDPIFAVTDAAALCADRGASGVLVGMLDLTQSPKMEAPIGVVGVFFRNASTFASDAVGVGTGAISVSGLLNRTAIQARLQLYLIDCGGKLAWTATTVANETHDGANIGSGYTQIVQEAIREAVGRLTPALLRQ